MSRRVVLAGASGLIGTALAQALTARGVTVIRLVRRPPSGVDEVRWDPTGRHLDPAALERADAVVNLAGAGIGDKRWSPQRKQAILDSRVDTTHAVATAVAQAGGSIRLVNGSAVGIYGDRGDQVLTEDTPAGTGFLSEVVRAWEGAAWPAMAAGAPVAFARTGIVLAREGGAAAPLLRLARLGLGGPLGRGRQWWAWITLADEVAALVHLVDGGLTGPVNLCAPEPARQGAIAKALGRALHRPAVLPAPAPALRLVLGEFAGDILGSQRVLPTRLVDDGFRHQHPDLESAAAWLTA